MQFKLTQADDVVGVQRRYDDETKRRAVQRKVPELFDKENYLLLLKAQEDKDEMTKDIELYCKRHLLVDHSLDMEDWLVQN